MFKGLTPDEVDSVVGAIKPEALQPQDTLIYAGDPVTTMYVIVSGELQRIDEQGSQVGPVLTKGDTFSEDALLPLPAPGSAAAAAGPPTHGLAVRCNAATSVYGFPRAAVHAALHFREACLEQLRANAETCGIEAAKQVCGLARLGSSRVVATSWESQSERGGGALAG